MDIIQNLSSLSSWQGIIFFALSTVVGFFYIRSGAKSKAEQIERNANKEAIEALQRQVRILQEETRYLRNALMEVGIQVTIDGQIIRIANKNKKEEG